MTRPDGIAEWAWEEAEAVLSEISADHIEIDGDSEVTIYGVPVIARLLMAAEARGRDALWQPIETAPMDDTLVDLWSVAGTRWTDMRRAMDGNGWSQRDYSHARYMIGLFSHWMPTPTIRNGCAS